MAHVAADSFYELHQPGFSFRDCNFVPKSVRRGDHQSGSSHSMNTTGLKKLSFRYTHCLREPSLPQFSLHRRWWHEFSVLELSGLKCCLREPCKLGSLFRKLSYVKLVLQIEKCIQIAEVLTPHFLEPKILSPEALVIFVLSPSN